MPQRHSGVLRAQGFTLFRQGLDGAITIIACPGAVRRQSGALKISFNALFDEEYRDIWLNIRLPRVLLAVLVGAALATAGVIMQGLFATQWLTRAYSASAAVLH